MYFFRYGVDQKVLSFTHCMVAWVSIFSFFLVLSHTSQLCMGLTCTDIKKAIWISFSSFTRSGSVLLQQKCPIVALLSGWVLEKFWTTLVYYIYLKILQSSWISWKSISQLSHTLAINRKICYCACMIMYFLVKRYLVSFYAVCIYREYAWQYLFEF